MTHSVQGASQRAVILEILRAHPLGLSEYDLMVALRKGGADGFEREVFRDSMTLFRAHFALMHALYSLSETLVADGSGYITISALRIAIEPVTSAPSTQISALDPMRAYYSNPANLKNTTPEELAKMLGAFWAKAAAYSDRDFALKILDLKHPTDLQTIKSRYRQLALEHHPDRGGDPIKAKRLNAAMEILGPIYKSSPR